MEKIKKLTGLTFLESKNALTVVCDDGFIIKAIYRYVGTLNTFDWQFINDDKKCIPLIPAHFTLRHKLSNALNAKKIAKRNKIEVAA